MADNTAQNGTDTIATDDVTTLNGGASSGVKVPRNKVTYGDDGTSRDVSSSFPLPASTPSATATGSITSANATPQSTGAASSYVMLAVPDNHTSWTIQLGGTFSAGTVVSFQCSLDGTTWFFTNGRRNLDTLGANEAASPLSTDVVGGAAPTGGNPSLWKGTTGGVKYIRVVCTTYTAADSVTVTILSSAGVGGTFLLGPVKQPNMAATLTSVALSTSSVTVLAANSSRLGATIQNDSGQDVYIAFAATATTTAYTLLLPAGAYYELPVGGGVYTGAISVIALAASGNLRVTEMA